MEKNRTPKQDTLANNAAEYWTRLPLILVLLLGAALLWHDLGAREVLGRDENATILKLDLPNPQTVLDASGVKANGQPSSMQPFYFLAQYPFWPLVGQSAFVLRFLPSIFALLAIALTGKLGSVLWNHDAGLVGALLLALLPLHVKYGQIIRPYTLLALLSLASAYYLIWALKTNRLVAWIGFVVTATLNVYTHFNSTFVLLAEGIFASIVWLATAIGFRKRWPEGQTARTQRYWPLAAPILAFLMVGALCLPALARLLELQWIGAGDADLGATIIVEFTRPFFHSFLYKIGLTTPWLRGLVLGLMAVGLGATFYHRRWQAALLVILWLAVPFVALFAIKSPRPFAERYLIFLPPMALLLVGEGTAAAGRLVGKLGKQPGSRTLQRGTVAAISIVLALQFVSPLSDYYADNRASHRLDRSLEVMEQDARPGDIVVVSPRFLVRPLAIDGADVLYLTEHPSAAELDELASQYERMWILYTSYVVPAEMQEPLDQWVQAQASEFAQVRIKASTVIAYRNQSLASPEAMLLDRASLLKRMAEVSEGRSEAWQRYGLLADAYQALSELYDSRGESGLAQEYQNRAQEAAETVPAP